MAVPNAELAYRVLDYITAHPDQHDQGTYVTRLDTVNQPGPACGTVACFAGWACILSGDVLELGQGLGVRGFDGDIHDRAEQLLGLDSFRATKLFIGTQRRAELPGVVAAIFGHRPAWTVVDEQAWRECAHRADYLTPAHHVRECAYHRGEVDEWGAPRRSSVRRSGLPNADGPYGVADWRQPLSDFERWAGVVEPVALDYDDVPPNAGSAS